MLLIFVSVSKMLLIFVSVSKMLLIFVSVSKMLLIFDNCFMYIFIGCFSNAAWILMCILGG